MPDEEFEPRLKLAIDAAREAGQLTLRYFRRADLEVEQKGDASPVTVADREAEHLLRRRILEAFPDDGILGEEFGESEGRSGYRWIVDPIDGTKSFIYGVPLYGTMVAVEQGQRCVIGVIALPPLEELAYASVGGGCWLVRGQQPPERARVSQVARLESGLMCTSAFEGLSDPSYGDSLRRVATASRLARTWGDCYGYVLVATGRAEVMVDPLMKPWDAAAVQPLIEEAGGRFTDWQGRPTIYSGQAIATNGRVHEAALAALRG